MKKQNNLLIARTIFYLIVFVSLGLIVVNEKSSSLLMPKIKKEIDTYIKNNYSSIENSLNIDKIEYKNSTYSVKATSKDNKNHYFYIYYTKKKITDTYKKDYLNGTNLFSNLEKKLKKEINEKTSTDCNIEILSTLDNYTTKVQERILNEEDLLSLKFYIIKEELIIDNWSSKEITKAINSFLTKINSKNIIPKYYEIIITNKNDITESIKISNLTADFITNPYQEQIINDIINDNNSIILKQSKIEYEYLN